MLTIIMTVLGIITIQTQDFNPLHQCSHLKTNEDCTKNSKHDSSQHHNKVILLISKYAGE